MITASEAYVNVTKHKESVDLNVIRTNKVILEFLSKRVEMASKGGKTAISVRIINSKDGDSIQTSEMGTSKVFPLQLMDGLRELGFKTGLANKHLSIEWGSKPTVTSKTNVGGIY